MLYHQIFTYSAAEDRYNIFMNSAQRNDRGTLFNAELGHLIKDSAIATDDLRHVYSYSCKQDGQILFTRSCLLPTKTSEKGEMLVHNIFIEKVEKEDLFDRFWCIFDYDGFADKKTFSFFSKKGDVNLSAAYEPNRFFTQYSGKERSILKTLIWLIFKAVKEVKPLYVTFDPKGRPFSEAATALLYTAYAVLPNNIRRRAGFTTLVADKTANPASLVCCVPKQVYAEKSHLFEGTGVVDLDAVDCESVGRSDLLNSSYIDFLIDCAEGNAQKATDVNKRISSVIANFKNQKLSCDFSVYSIIYDLLFSDCSWISRSETFVMVAYELLCNRDLRISADRLDENGFFSEKNALRVLSAHGRLLEKDDDYVFSERMFDFYLSDRAGILRTHERDTVFAYAVTSLKKTAEKGAEAFDALFSDSNLRRRIFKSKETVSGLTLPENTLPLYRICTFLLAPLPGFNGFTALISDANPENLSLIFDSFEFKKAFSERMDKIYLTYDSIGYLLALNKFLSDMKSTFETEPYMVSLMNSAYAVFYDKIVEKCDTTVLHTLEYRDFSFYSRCVNIIADHSKKDIVEEEEEPASEESVEELLEIEETIVQPAPEEEKVVEMPSPSKKEKKKKNKNKKNQEAVPEVIPEPVVEESLVEDTVEEEIFEEAPAEEVVEEAPAEETLTEEIVEEPVEISASEEEEGEGLLADLSEGQTNEPLPEMESAIEKKARSLFAEPQAPAPVIEEPSTISLENLSQESTGQIAKALVEAKTETEFIRLWSEVEQSGKETREIKEIQAFLGESLQGAIYQLWTKSEKEQLLLFRKLLTVYNDVSLFNRKGTEMLLATYDFTGALLFLLHTVKKTDDIKLKAEYDGYGSIPYAEAIKRWIKSGDEVPEEYLRVVLRFCDWLYTEKDVFSGNAENEYRALNNCLSHILGDVLGEARGGEIFQQIVRKYYKKIKDVKGYSDEYVVLIRTFGGNAAPEKTAEARAGGIFKGFFSFIVSLVLTVPITAVLGIVSRNVFIKGQASAVFVAVALLLAVTSVFSVFRNIPAMLGFKKKAEGETVNAGYKLKNIYRGFIFFFFTLLSVFCIIIVAVKMFFATDLIKSNGYYLTEGSAVTMAIDDVFEYVNSGAEGIRVAVDSDEFVVSGVNPEDRTFIVKREASEDGITVSRVTFGLVANGLSSVTSDEIVICSVSEKTDELRKICVLAVSLLQLSVFCYYFSRQSKKI